jgi:cytochrome P450
MTYGTAHVADWAEDFDLFDLGFMADPYPVYEELRGRCPVAHSDRWGGAWMPTRYEDVVAIAHDTEHFSSADVGVTPFEGVGDKPLKSPPITSDPPDHNWHRRLILPFFSPRSVDRYERYTRELCRRLVDDLLARGRGDAAADYAQQIPPRVIAEMLGIPVSRTDEFVEWVRGVLELGPLFPEERLAYRMKIIDYFRELVAERKERPGDDIISYLLAQTHDGEPIRDGHVIGTCTLLLVAGIDTTWSSIGSALLHLATHPDDRRRLVAEPELIPTAVEEFLRAYSPVTMARVVTEEVEVNGRQLCPGERVLLTFPAANRDPEMFEAADEVHVDRAVNRHVAFGVGIHRCAGSNLARMEMKVALEEWLARIPEFTLVHGAEVTWAGGQVRGPRSVPVVLEG